MPAGAIDPSILQVRSPLAQDDLAPLDRRCRRVQFDEPLADSDHERLASFLSDYPNVTLRMYGHYADSPVDFSFLRHYSTLRRFHIDLHRLDSLQGLHCLPRTLLALGVTPALSPTLDLSPLHHFDALEELFVSAPGRPLATVGSMTSLRALSLSKVRIATMDVLAPLAGLRELSIGSTPLVDLSFPPGLRELRRLTLRTLGKLASLEHVTELPNLESLYLDHLPSISRLPSLGPMTALRSLRIERLSALTDLAPAALAQRLEQLAVISMPHLLVNDFRPFLKHPAIRRVYYSTGPFSAALFGRGGHLKQEAVRELLGVAAADHDAWPNWE